MHQFRSRIIAWLVCVSVVSLSGTTAIAEHQPARVASAKDAETLLEGVTAIPPVGTAGQVAVWGEGAFAVVLGSEGRTRVPIVAAGELGRGRVMAWAHGWGSADAAA